MPGVSNCLTRAALLPTKGQTLNHVGFEVKGLEAFCKKLEATGVKFDKNSPFAKKSNKTNMIFIVVGVVLGLIIVSLLIYAFLQMKGSG